MIELAECFFWCTDVDLLQRSQLVLYEKSFECPSILHVHVPPNNMMAVCRSWDKHETIVYITSLLIAFLASVPWL